MTLARAVPHAAVGYTLYEGAKKVRTACATAYDCADWLVLRKVVMPTRELETPFRRTLVGAVAGA